MYETLLGGVLIFFAFMWVTVALIVAKQAEKYGRGLFRWFFFTMIFGIFAVIIFLLLTSNEQPSKQQPASPE